MTSTVPDTNFAGLVPGTWVIDPDHSEVGFTVRHLMSKVRGQFRDFEGSLLIAEDPSRPSPRASTLARSTPATRTATTTFAPLTSSPSRPAPR